jgi:hypothetical protein
MSHGAPPPAPARTRAAIWLLVLAERCALAVLRRGALRKRVLARVDRALHQIHVELCGRERK